MNLPAADIQGKAAPQWCGQLAPPSLAAAAAMALHLLAAAHPSAGLAAAAAMALLQGHLLAAEPAHPSAFLLQLAKVLLRLSVLLLLPLLVLALKLKRYF